MTIDQAEFIWESTPYSDVSLPSTTRRSARSDQAVAVVRAIALLVIATLAILVLLPAAIAAQTAFAA
ncbi:MAG TPA: hypothetical protein VE011_10140 [Candidatus Dormibacteraeota bacterium]|nr:hypothetical protein [Candidatus Dormibacteraeota bacterium]